MLCDYDYDYAARPEHTALINALYGMPRLNTLSITYFKDLEGIDFSRLPELQQLNIQGYASDDGETDSTTISSLDLSKCAKLKILERLVEQDVDLEFVGMYEPSLNDIFVEKAGDEA